VRLDDESVWISHLNYELTTMAELPRWVEHFVHNGAAVVHNACLEATMIHGRLLIEFVVGRGRRHPRDVQPSDFLPGWVHPDPDLLRRHLAIIDPYLAHLSRDRADGTTASPGFLTDLVDDVLAGMELFVDALLNAASPYSPAFQGMLSVARTKRALGPTSWPGQGWGT
jgi:hypothetical protein